MDKKNEIMRIRSYVKSVVCATCLSSNRRFVKDDTSRNVLLLFPKFISIEPEQDNVCWECHSTLKKLWKFHIQALNAKQILTSILNKNEGTVKPLSSLQRSPLFVANVDPTTVLKPLNIPKVTTKKEEVQIPFIKSKEKLPARLANYLTNVLIKNNVSITPRIKDSSILKTQTNVKITPLPVKQELNIEYEADTEKFDLDAQIQQYKISKEEVDTNESDSTGDETENVSVPIADMRHIHINAIIPNTLLIVKNKDTPNVAHKENRPKRKRKRNRNEIGMAKTDIVIYNNVLEKDLILQEVKELIEIDRSSEYYLRWKYRCDKCVIGFEEEGFYKAHLNRHRESYGSEVCSICEQRFKDTESQRSHYKAHFTAYYCTLCLYSSFSIEAIAEHGLKTHGSSSQHRCAKCPSQYDDAKQLDEHIKTAHPPPIECKECGKIFTQNFNLKKHLMCHKGTDVHRCQVCQKPLKGLSNVKLHMKNVHERNTDEVFYCKPCDKFFKSAYILKNHLQYSRNHAQLLYECDHCGNKFPHKTYLMQHVKTHIEGMNRTFKCNLCRKTYNFRCHLRKHVRVVHEGIPVPKNHICELCARGFGSKRQLEQHMNTHTGARPYVCTTCGATFGHSGALYTHNRLKHAKKQSLAKK